MISFEVFEDVTYEITDTFPEVFFRELNGGVMVREYSRLHPAALDHDLFVLGEYRHHSSRCGAMRRKRSTRPLR